MRPYIVILVSLFLFYECTDPKTGTRLSDSGEATTVASRQEQHRLQFHFSPDSMWMNDPNGMLYYEGEYHLFFQYYPDSTVWGPMHWGHAVSEDLIHWEQLPIALYPDSLGYIFSGSAVVDWNNSSGFGTDQKPPLVAIYTYHDSEGAREGTLNYQTQAIAYSNDLGRSWMKYKGNPVIANPGIKDFRDPKVIWHEASQKWVMIFAAFDHVKIYGSSNLKDWQLVSEFGKDQGSHGGVWECPDLFPMTVDDTGETKWVMIVSLGDGAPNGGSGTQYFIGDFDGQKFVNSHPADQILWLDYGRDNYAGVTWSDIPVADGRRIFIGWMSNWKYANVVPTEKWRSAMTLPRELSLVRAGGEIRMKSFPVSELEKIMNASFDVERQRVTGEFKIDVPFDVATSEILLEFDDLQGAGDFGIALSNTIGQKLLVGYEPGNRRFYIDRSASGTNNFSHEFSGRQYGPRIAEWENMQIRLLLDVSSVELFADDGLTTMTALFFPDETFNQVKLYANEGNVSLSSAKFTGIKSIWQNY